MFKDYGRKSARAIAVYALAALALAGCASVPMAGLDADRAAKTFQVPAEMSRIYVFRDETFGAAIPMTLTINGQLWGRTAAKTYLVADVQPGLYAISSIAEDTSTMRFEAKAGRAHFVWQEVKMGMWQARSLLQEVDEAAARERVAACTLAAPDPAFSIPAALSR